LPSIFRSLGNPATLAGRIVRPHRNRLAHGKPPQFAILNHAAIDSGIPRESATQRLGIRQAARHLDENRHCIAGLVLGWLCYSIASNMPANDRLGSKAVRRRREKDDVGFCQIGKEAIRFTRPPIDLSHRPRDGSVVSFLHCVNDPQPEGHMASYIARRKFLATLLGGAAAWPLAARAQQPAMPVVGFLASGSPELYPHRVAAVRPGLNDCGYVEDENIP